MRDPLCLVVGLKTYLRCTGNPNFLVELFTLQLLHVESSVSLLLVISKSSDAFMINKLLHCHGGRDNYVEEVPSSVESVCFFLQWLAFTSTDTFLFCFPRQFLSAESVV